MKIVAISDTHGQEVSNLPRADLLIHSGDWSGRGTLEEHNKFVIWMSKIRLNYAKICLVPGNHDRYSAANPALVEDEFQRIGIDFLVDRTTYFRGHTIHGTPWSPEFGNWAWMANDIERQAYCSLIDPTTSILISHSPPKGYLDVLGPNSSEPGKHAGCPYIAEAIHKIKPALAVVGHIHENSGIQLVGNTLLVNAASMDDKYRLVNGFKVIYL